MPFPGIEFLMNLRKIGESPLLPQITADYKAFADSLKTTIALAQPLAADASLLGDFLSGLFAAAPPRVGAGPVVGGLLRDRRHEKLIAEVKAQAQQYYRTVGLSGIDNPTGAVPRFGFEPRADWDIESVWAQADGGSNGPRASDVILDELSHADGYAEAFDAGVDDAAAAAGTLWQRFLALLKSAGAWIAAHKDQILAAAKILLSLLLMLGLL